MTPEIRANMEAYYGLDKSLPEQYITYMNNLLHGDLGYSMKYVNQSVNRIIADAFSVFGRPGNPCADICRDFRRDSWCSRIVEPREKAGCGLYHYCNHRNIDPGLYHGVFAAVFLRDPMGGFCRSLNIPVWRIRFSPSIAVGFYTLAMVSRLMRASMLEVVTSDYTKTAKAKGLSKWRITIKHQIRNAIMPVVTVLGPLVASVLTGTFVIEALFAIPGLGKHYVQSISNNDYTLVLGMTIFFGAFLILMNLVVDILYGIIDPRIRLSGKGK